jgi:hypothetical protein
MLPFKIIKTILKYICKDLYQYLPSSSQIEVCRWTDMKTFACVLFFAYNTKKAWEWWENGVNFNRRKLRGTGTSSSGTSLHRAKTYLSTIYFILPTGAILSYSLYQSAVSTWILCTLAVWMLLAIPNKFDKDVKNIIPWPNNQWQLWREWKPDLLNWRCDKMQWMSPEGKGKWIL